MADLVNGLGGPSGFGVGTLGPSDDGSTAAINITSVFPNGFQLFGHTYNAIYINNNGNITFNSALSTYTPSAIGAGFTSPIIAPFWADVDTRGGATTPTGGNTTGSNLVWYNLDTSNKVVTITWDDVGYYSEHTNKTDAFQLQLIAAANGAEYIKFIYQNIEWTAGDASGGSGGLGGTAARAGYSAGDGVHYYEIPGSGNQAAMLALPTTTGDIGASGISEFAAGLSGVYNLADPVVSLAGTTPVTSINFGSVRAGSNLIKAITVTNGAPASAENLDASVTATGGATATGTITQLAAGQSDGTDLAVGLSTATAGAVTGSVVLNFVSDGTATDGLPPTAVSSQTITVSGTVFQEARPTPSLPGTLVFHVGDSGTASLTLANAAGYVETLAASVTGATGGISAPLGALPEIVAGATDAIPVNVSTATAGTVSGSLALSYATDGAGTDGAPVTAIGSDTVAVTATVDNYAALGLSASVGQLTFDGTKYVLNLGSVSQGGAALVANLTAANSAAGPADALSGTVTIGNGTGYSNTGPAGYSALGAGQSTNTETVSLSTATAGTFSETLVFHSTGSNASGYSGALADQQVVVTGTVTPSAPSGHLSADLTLPATTTVGQSGTGVVTYANTGNAALPAQILEISSATAGLKLAGTSTYSDDLLVLGTGSGAAPGTLQPRIGGTLSFTYAPLSSTAGDQVGVSVGSPVAGTAIDWASLKDALRPPTVDVADWNNVWAAFVNRVGGTTDSLTAALAQDATNLAQIGQPTNDVGTLLQYELFQASGGLAGTFLSAATDIAPTASGLSLSLGRVYNGTLLGRDATGLFGDGWTSTYETSAVADSSGTVYVTSAGALHVFALQADGSYVASSGDTATLTLSGGAYRMVQDGAAEQFRPDGKLASVTDTNGNTVALTYGSTGVLQQVRDLATGETITFTASASGRITSAADSDGRTVGYSYDASGARLLSATGPDGTTTYTYAAADGTATANALTSVTDPDGTGATFTYDAVGRLASQAAAGGGNQQTYSYATPGQVTVTDALGQATTLAYGANGTVAQTTDALGHVTQLASDNSGDLTGLTSASGTAYRYAYDSAGNLTSYTSPLGSTVSANYLDGTANLASFTDQLGTQTRYSYDSAGNVTGITYQDGTGDSYQYGANGLLSSSSDAAGNTARYGYDSAGNLTSKSFGDGTVDTYSYDAHGNLNAATGTDGGTTRYTYDSADHLTGVTDAAGRVESYTYDASGRLATRTEPDGSVTQYGYDGEGRLATLQDGAGNLIDRYTYNAVGEVTRTDTGNGASTSYTYDANGDVLTILALNADGSTAASLAYTYDANGQVTAEATSSGTWSYGYDASTRLVSAGFASSSSLVQSQAIAYAYDAAGNRVSETVNGVTTNYVTNALDQYTSAGGTTYTYDADGNLATATDSAGTTRYTYDESGRLTGETGPNGTFGYTYDALGNMVSSTVNGAVSQYINDPLSLAVGGSPLTSVAEVLGSTGTTKDDYYYGLGTAAEASVGGQYVYLVPDASGNTVASTGPGGSGASSTLYGPYGEALGSSNTENGGLGFGGALGVTTGQDGLSFMRARFYDAQLGRFLTEDPLGLKGGVDSYDYTSNNPVNFVDPLGLYKILGLGAGAASGYLATGTALLGGEYLAGAFTVGVAFGVLPFVATVGVGVGLLALGGYAAYEAGKTIGESLDGPSLEYGFDSAPSLVLSGITAKFPIEGVFKSLGDSSKELAGHLYDAVGDKLAEKIGKLITGEEEKSSKDSKLTPSEQTGKTATGDGCPHFTTYDGLHFDFQGAGEFIAARSTVASDTFQVQLRIEPEGSLDSAVSIITQIAIQVGSHRVTFGVPQGDDAPRPNVVQVDGAAIAISQANPVFTLPGGTVTEVSTNDYRVVLITGEIVTVNPFGDGMGFSISLPDTAAPGSVRGFLGPDEGQANVFTLPDGTVLQQPLTQAQLYKTFADAWRVDDANSLLDYAPGQTTATFTNTMYPREILTLADFPPDLVAQAAALAAAAGITDPTLAADAEFDYISMGNPSFFAEDAMVASAGTTTPTAAVVTNEVAPPPSIGVLPVAPQVVESASTTTPVSFTVNLTSAASSDTVVTYAVVPGGGVNAGKNYLTAADFGGTLPTGSVTIAAGRTQAEITVAVPNSAIGAATSRWLMVSVTGNGTNPVYDPAGQTEIVNNQPVAGTLAVPTLQLLGTATSVVTGNGTTLTHTGNAYTLDLGTVIGNTVLPAMQFALANAASLPADSLSASFTATTGDGFTISGNQPTGVVMAGAASRNLAAQADTSVLGVHTMSLTVTPTDVNDTGYSASLPNLSLTLRENVVAPAQAALATQIVSLPNARVGSADTQALTVTNAANQPAAALDVTAVAGAGTTVSGGITALAPGASDSTDLLVGVGTGTAGLQSGTVTLSAASDLGNGVTVAALPNLPVAVSGAVFRAASAAVSLTQSILHVGDIGTVGLAVSNTAAADGYSEALVATLTGTSGSATTGSAGPTAKVVAESTDAASLSIAVSTAQAGVQTGSATLALVSDGGTGTGSIDGLGQLALPMMTVPVFVTVNNYAAAQLAASMGTLSSGATPNSYVLDLGTVAQGAAPVVATLQAENVATGPADDLTGTFTLSGRPAFVNSGFGSLSVTAAGTSSAAGTVSLSTATPGTFAETVVLHPQDSNAAGFSAALGDQTVTVMGTVLPAGQASGDVHLTTFDGLRYDFQAVGDYTLVQGTDPATQFRVQVETRAYPLIQATSVITKEAAQIGNDVVTFDADGSTVAINGILDTTLDGFHHEQLLPGGRLDVVSPNQVSLVWTSGERLDITFADGYLNDTVTLGPKDGPGSVQGLLGGNAGQANDIALPDGTVLQQPVPDDQILTRFADAWQVNDAHSLLDGTANVSSGLGGSPGMTFLTCTSPGQALTGSLAGSGQPNDAVTMVGSLASLAGDFFQNFAPHDLFDVTDVTPGQMTLRYAGSASAGDLVISGGGGGTSLHLVGDLSGERTFHSASDQHGGTLVSFS